MLRHKIYWCYNIAKYFNVINACLTLINAVPLYNNIFWLQVFPLLMQYIILINRMTAECQWQCQHTYFEVSLFNWVWKHLDLHSVEISSTWCHAGCKVLSVNLFKPRYKYAVVDYKVSLDDSEHSISPVTPPIFSLDCHSVLSAAVFISKFLWIISRFWLVSIEHEISEYM